MRRLALVTLLVVGLFGGAFAQDHKEQTGPPPRVAPPATEIRYVSEEGRYSVTLSQQPSLSSQNITAASGDSMVQYMASASLGAGLVMVGYFDYPNTVVFSLDQARNGMVNSLNGTLLDEESISLGGSPGRQVKIAAKTETGMDFIDRARFYDVNRRIYVLQCLVPKSDDGETAAQTCGQFFDSFRVRSGP